ncbi:hypothetical protein NUW54_g7551 [Trametes sanguinea]|uniref:Uncharacterized protein n=1 Tax=Trametes sanguinea TaxID=158606 RepID=A0ACC1PME3_9APHY|nr:hypothetical protein NUW54_g7551 [Trametes sanguinea]
MRACRLRKGDNVLIHGNAKAVVIKPPTSSAAGHQAEDEVLLDLDEDGEEPFQVQNIRLAPRTVSFEWTDRMLSEDAILPVIRPKLSRASPTPSRLSAPSEGSVRAGRKPLNKTGLVITLSPNYGGKDREALTSEIRRNGGVVLDEWTTLFAMDGTITQKGQRWSLTTNDIKWKNRNDVDRAFLISDEHIQKPKYLMALALGIPCVSVDWVREVVEKQMDLDWQPYLLPAGFSNHLHTRVSQLIDVDWGNSKHHLTDIATSQVPSKVFSGKSIVCVSPDFVPGRQRGKKNDNSSIDSVPRIILCMGADTVEAVTDEKYASHDIREYDYIVLREKQAFERLRGYERCVDVNWVKDCLISGRLTANTSTLGVMARFTRMVSTGCSYTYWPHAQWIARRTSRWTFDTLFSMDAPRTTVDSANTERIQFLEPSPRTLAEGPAWFFNASRSLLGAAYNDSLTGCRVRGASAVFRFHGSSVSVVGSIVRADGGDAAVSVYSVDGNKPTSFTTPRVNERTDSVRFFASGPLPLGDHVLIINIAAASSAAPYYVDYLQYTTDALTLSSPSALPATHSASPVLLSHLVLKTLAELLHTVRLPSREKAYCSPWGRSFGGVVGGLALICLLIALLHWNHRRHPTAHEFDHGTKVHRGESQRLNRNTGVLLTDDQNTPTVPPLYGVTAPAPSPVTTSSMEDTTNDVPSSSRHSTPLPLRHIGNQA